MMRISRTFLIVFVVLALLLEITLISLGSAKKSGQANFAPSQSLSLSGKQRLLVLAPHCDDETLGAGGLIQAALQQDMDVKVVIATNGDGFLFATMEDFHRLYPHHQDFIRMGSERQQESLSALELLGLSASRVVFLSYPDRGTPALWNEYWDSSNPYYSPYIGATSSPYPITYNPKANYSGKSYLADLVSIIREYQPDLIVYPDPEDVHPDHWGLSVFTRAALAEVEQENPGYQPDAYTYLVHRPDFPEPKGLRPDLSLVPPERLTAINPTWYTLDLPLLDETVKGGAVLEYRSQLSLLYRLLASFVRQNELFTKPEPVELPDLAEGEWQNPGTWRDTAGKPIEPVQRDPESDFVSRKVLPGADIIALYAARQTGGNVIMCMEMRGKIEPTLVYTIHLSAFGDQGVRHSTARTGNRAKAGVIKAVTSGKYACAQTSLSDLGNPRRIFTGANVEELGISMVDQVAWQQVNLTTPAPGQ